MHTVKNRTMAITAKIIIVVNEVSLIESSELSLWFAEVSDIDCLGGGIILDILTTLSRSIVFVLICGVSINNI